LLALYALVLVTSPLMHHDLACHRTSLTHCTACTGNPAASRVEQPTIGLLRALPVVGQVETPRSRTICAAVPLHVPGRSPPA